MKKRKKQSNHKTKQQKRGEKNKERAPKRLRGSQRERKMLARKFKNNAESSTRSRTGILQVCFQHNINFPFIKSPMQRPPVLTALSAPCGGPLRPPRRGSLLAQVSCALQLATLTGQYTQFIHTARPQSVCCSYPPQHRNVLLLDRSRQRCSVFESVCACKREKYPSQGECI